MRKARQFATSEAGFTKDELDELCVFIIQNQMSQDATLPVFGKSHVIRLLTVRPKHRRKALQGAAIKNAWSVSRLEAEIGKRYGTRRDGGRQRRIPKDQADFFLQIEQMTERWRRWWREVTRKPEELKEQHVLLSDIPPEMGKKVKKASKAVIDLQTAVVEHLKEILPSRAQRLPFRADESKADPQDAADRRPPGRKKQ